MRPYKRPGRNDERSPAKKSAEVIDEAVAKAAPKITTLVGQAFAAEQRLRSGLSARPSWREIMGNFFQAISRYFSSLFNRQRPSSATPSVTPAAATPSPAANKAKEAAPRLDLAQTAALQEGLPPVTPSGGPHRATGYSSKDLGSEAGDPPSSEEERGPGE